MLDSISDGHTIPLTSNLFKQPATNKEEAWQSEQKKHIIPSHHPVTKTIATYMGIYHENHCKSSHRIDVCYSLTCHICCKSTKNNPIFWQIKKNIVTLWHERENQLDRLGQSTRRLQRSVLSPTPITRMVLLSISPSTNHGNFHLYFWLSEERPWQR